MPRRSLSSHVNLRRTRGHGFEQRRQLRPVAAARQRETQRHIQLRAFLAGRGADGRGDCRQVITALRCSVGRCREVALDGCCDWDADEAVWFTVPCDVALCEPADWLLCASEAVEACLVASAVDGEAFEAVDDVFDPDC